MADNINKMDVGVRIYNDASVNLSFSANTQADATLESKKIIKVSLRALTYEKNIYSPCFARAEIYVIKPDDVTLFEIASFFVGLKVDLTHYGSSALAASYFVYKATPSINKNGLTVVTLDIYSLDKLLDIVKYSCSYTGRKLRGEILPDAVARCAYNGVAVPIADNDKLSLLADTNNNEFYQPYVVQYNETAYSMLARTANRCGEFLYFEDGTLHLGLSASTAIEVKNVDDGIRFLSVSYANSLGTTFGGNQAFHIDNYQSSSGDEAAQRTIVTQFNNVTIALSKLSEMVKDTETQKTLKECFNIFEENQAFYTCYYKAKKAHAAYVYYKKEIKEVNEKIKSIASESTGADGKKTVKFLDSRIKEEIEPCLKDLISEKENELQTARDKQKRNDYYHKKIYLDELKKKRDEAEAEFRKTPEDDPEWGDKYAAFLAVSAEYNTEKEKYNPDIDTLIIQEAMNIDTLDKQLKTLSTDLKSWTDKNTSEVVKDRIYNYYKQEAIKRLKKQYDDLDRRRTELNTAIEQLMIEPAESTNYNSKKNSTPWNLFDSWEKVVKEEDNGYTDRIDKKIWQETLKEGKNRFPISIKDKIKDLKSRVEKIKKGLDKPENVLDNKNDKDDANLYCDTIIDYCNAYETLDKDTKVLKKDVEDILPGVYDLEYANDEYLQTVKKDKGCYNDFYFSGMHRNQSDKSYAAYKLLQIIFNFLKSTDTFNKFVLSTLADEVVYNGYVAKVKSDFQDSYKKSFITEYKLNGKKSKDLNIGDGKESTTLFTNSSHKNSNSDVQGKKMDDIFSGIFYKSVYIAERALSEQKITISIDCSTNKKEPTLGSKIKYAGAEYIITSVKGALTPHQTPDGTVLQLEQTVEAIPVLVGTLYLPPMGDMEHFRRSDPQIATVTDDNDPSFEGRVRVRFHWQSSKDEASPWLRVGTPYATSGGGMLFIPQVGDQVMLDFERGNVERPYVSNSLWSEGNKIYPPNEISSAQTRRTISSKNGHSITFIDKKNAAFLSNALSSFRFMSYLGKAGNLGQDESAAGGVQISDSYGIYTIDCSADKRNITISSPFGDVKLNAFTGITISAPNGDVKIVGKNVEITAGNRVTITSGKYVKDGIGDFKQWSALTEKGQWAEAATDTLAETVLGHVDLSIVRHVEERIVRPVSASLQLKSYSFILIDSGTSDCSIEDMKSKSAKNTINKWSNWGKDENGNLKEGKGSQFANSFGKQFSRIVGNFVPERNMWNNEVVQKSAVIIAGNQYNTDDNKTELIPNPVAQMNPVAQIYEVVGGNDDNEALKRSNSLSYQRRDKSKMKGIRDVGKIQGEVQLQIPPKEEPQDKNKVDANIEQAKNENNENKDLNNDNNSNIINDKQEIVEQSNNNQIKPEEINEQPILEGGEGSGNK